MSVARGFGLNGKSIYMNVAKPDLVWCQFTVNSADTGGLGITGLKSNGYIEYVFMHTSQTPGKVGNFTNPNPSAGFAVVKFKNNFNYPLGVLDAMVQPPPTSTSTTSTTAGHVYQITTLGSTTLAQWQAAGVPAGYTPAVGLSFVAIATGAIGGTGDVGVPGLPAYLQTNIVGNPLQTIANSNIASNAGAQVILQFSGATNSSTTTLIPTSPADSAVVSLCFPFDASTVTVDGL